MAGATVRARKAGERLGESIIEMVHLMYQNNTAKNFYIGLLSVLRRELVERKIEEYIDGVNNRS